MPERGSNIAIPEKRPRLLVLDEKKSGDHAVSLESNQYLSMDRLDSKL
jgi:hypothetical protein